MKKKFPVPKPAPQPTRGVPVYSFFNNGVSASLLMNYLACPEMAKIAMEGFKPAIQSGPAQFGTLAHSVMEKAYILTSKKKKLTRGTVLRIVEEVCDWHQKEFGSRWSDKEVNLLDLQAAQLRAVLPRYFEYWKDDFEWVSLEQWFSLPYEGTVLKGRMDAAFNQGKELWIWENKTSSRIEEESLVTLLERDFQSFFYRLVAKLQTRRVPAGSYHNVIRRPGMEPRKNEDLDSYQKRVEAHIDEDPTHYFKRFEVPMQPSELDVFETEFKQLLKEFEAWTKAGYPTKKFGMPCQGKFGMCWNVPICYHNNLRSFVKIERRKS